MIVIPVITPILGTVIYLVQTGQLGVTMEVKLTTTQAFYTRTKALSTQAKERIDASALAANVTTPTVDGKYWVIAEIEARNIVAFYDLVKDLAVE